MDGAKTTTFIEVTVPNGMDPTEWADTNWEGLYFDYEPWSITSSTVLVWSTGEQDNANEMLVEAFKTEGIEAQIVRRAKTDVWPTLAQRIANTFQPFYMVRNADETGVSGTGRVLDGVVFPSGSVSCCWRSDTPSINTYRSWVEFKHLHIDSHPTNGTEIRWGAPL
jgi:hypothetical protein